LNLVALHDIHHFLLQMDKQAINNGASELRGGDPLAIAQKLHAHVTVEDCRNHL
jgi:hypothetical protein